MQRCVRAACLTDVVDGGAAAVVLAPVLAPASFTATVADFLIVVPDLVAASLAASTSNKDLAVAVLGTIGQASPRILVRQPELVPLLARLEPRQMDVNGYV